MTRNDDLETDLRTMLRERAEDVSAVPDAIFAFERQSADDATVIPLHGHRHTQRTRRRTLLLVAAAVVAVLAAAGVVSAVQGDRDRPPDVGTQHPSPSQSTTPTTPPTPRPDYAGRAVPLDGAGFSDESEYLVGERDRLPGREVIGVGTQDPPQIRGRDGYMPYPDVVTVFEKGVLDGAAVTRSWRTVRLGSATARIGRLPLGAGTGPSLPTLAFRSAAGRWVLVQGRTAAASTASALTALARVLRPDERSYDTFAVFRLTYLPAGLKVTRQWNPPGEYTRILIVLESSSTDVQIAVATDEAGVGLKRGKQTRTVDGKTVHLNRDAGTALVRTAPTGAFGIRVSRHGSPGDVGVRQRRDLDRIVDGLRFPTFGQGKAALTWPQVLPK